MKLKKDKQKEAAERQAYYDGLTVNQRLDRLDAKLGTCIGAVKERAKLHALLSGGAA